MTASEKVPSQLVEFDDAADIVIIDGVRVSADVLRTFTRPTPAGIWFRIRERNEFGTVTIEQRRDEEVGHG